MKWDDYFEASFVLHETVIELAGGDSLSDVERVSLESELERAADVMDQIVQEARDLKAARLRAARRRARS